ncbi:hypothetical protein [Nesterenkonia rhizosphaerae]|uniref:Replication protein n=1 Tax=Nesterenkonia rhizosphaerae TaxID=1348272 RepID=A0ABP9FTF1_9MICC
MAENHRRLNVGLWREGSDFREVPPYAQLLYLMMIGDDHTRSTGYLILAPGRFSEMAPTWTTEDVETALSELEDRGYIIVDRKYQEVLIRTYTKHDYHLKNEKRAKGVANQLAFIQSPAIKDAFALQHARLQIAQPELVCWAVWQASYPQLYAEIQRHRQALVQEGQPDAAPVENLDYVTGELLPDEYDMRPTPVY